MPFVRFILSFKYHVFNAGGRSVRPKRDACANGADKIDCGWRLNVYKNLITFNWRFFFYSLLLNKGTCCIYSGIPIKFKIVFIYFFIFKLICSHSFQCLDQFVRYGFQKLNTCSQIVSRCFTGIATKVLMTKSICDLHFVGWLN